MNKENQRDIVALTEKEIKAIQFALQYYIEDVTQEMDKQKDRLNSLAHDVFNDIVKTSTSALEKIISSTGLSFQLSHYPVTEDDIDKFTA